MRCRAASLALTNVQGANSGVYRCVATNVHGAVNSQPATLTVMVPPTITTHPANANAPVGQPLLLAVTATGPGTLTFQWQKDGVNLANADAFTVAKAMPQFNRADRKWVKDDAGNWCYITPQGAFYRKGKLAGQLGAAYWTNPNALVGPSFLQLTNVQAPAAGAYRCVVTNPGGSTTSNAATVTVP